MLVVFCYLEEVQSRDFLALLAFATSRGGLFDLSLPLIMVSKA